MVGSAGQNTSNLQLANYVKQRLHGHFNIELWKDLSLIPHFNTAQANTPPEIVGAFLTAIENAAGVIISTPEYIFSIPARLKNAFEWCVATTVFSEKPVALITASSNGVRGHEELQLIMKTLGATLLPETTLLVQGVKGKVSPEGSIINTGLQADLSHLITEFCNQLKNKKEF